MIDYQKAQRLNPYYYWKDAGDSPIRKAAKTIELDRVDPASREYADAVYAYQMQHEPTLIPDAILGTVTAGHINMHGQIVKPQPGKLIVDGKEYATEGFKLVNWHDANGLSFYGHPSLWRPRTKKVERLVLHWDVCRTSRGCFQALLQRGLSVHLMLDGDGTVYQALDLQTAVAKHASGTNDNSVGIEICNPVELKWQSVEPQRAKVVSTFPSGWKPEHLDFTPAQKKTIAPLAKMITEIMGIPQQIPDEAKLPKSGFVGDAWNGVMGHYHVRNTNGKWDPGTTLWPVLLEAGFASQGV